MPRCLRLHKIPAPAHYCAMCGARAVPGWSWASLSVLLLALLFGANARRPGETSSPPLPTTTANIIAAYTETVTPTEAFTPAPTRTRTPTASPTSTISPTPTNTRTPTASHTPTILSTPTSTQSPTATLYPRTALRTFHNRYVVAKNGSLDWILRQETSKNNPCAWFRLSPEDHGRVSLQTCNGYYLTAPLTGKVRSDWLLKQEPLLSECGKFTVIYLGDGNIALSTCNGHYVTSGDWGWQGNLQWALVAETTVLLDWEEFTLEGQ